MANSDAENIDQNIIIRPEVHEQAAHMPTWIDRMVKKRMGDFSTAEKIIVLQELSHQATLKAKKFEEGGLESPENDNENKGKSDATKKRKREGPPPAPVEYPADWYKSGGELTIAQKKQILKDNKVKGFSKLNKETIEAPLAELKEKLSS